MTTLTREIRDTTQRTPSRLVIAGLLLGIVLATLDGTIVGTALPVIVDDLGGLDHLSWVVTAYLLATAVTTPLWGKIGDLYGRKGSYLTSIAVFLAGSVLCGLAQDMGQLIAFRAVQGIGAGGLFVGALSLVGTLLGPAGAGRSQSVIGVLLPAAMIGGPLIGGFLTDQLDWRWVFYVNVPIGAVALAVVGAGVHVRTERVRARVDLAGAALLTVTILALTLLSSWAGTTYAWTSPPIAALAVVAVAALAGFVAVERRAAEPVIPPRLFRDRNFGVAQVLSFTAGAAMLAAATYLPQYMQHVRGMSSTGSGLLLLPLMLGMMGAQLAIGRRVSGGGRYRPYPLAGGALATAGALSLLLLGTQTPAWAASALTLALGVGLGCLLQPSLLITMNSAEPRDLGAAGGTQTLLRTVGGSLGVAVLGSVFIQRAHGGAGPAAIVAGLHGVAVGTAVLCAVAFGAARLVREVPLRTQRSVRES
ncbi:DHA2 family efflux MFS transporter permease subunit [Streptomyces sp. VRA16 Mangrove soil]|uniref:DHA2 family efflux MFS transporter permease subunit n=1 Tax=Streptomyces sp. VRA16 Mangrove soil TaxID=2817434 RepID=UPI001A9E79F7|nr:DHA2 family efflux MFS transporter permease subunit [Streptomyces sp. VRA16 Mangrove soil]MBO1334771.1 DHA2 family efflux MFS transporter permease subunit [Streptomyces sp. VRA16 Mangrove soil]